MIAMVSIFSSRERGVIWMPKDVRKNLNLRERARDFCVPDEAPAWEHAGCGRLAKGVSPGVCVGNAREMKFR